MDYEFPVTRENVITVVLVGLMLFAISWWFNSSI